MSTRARCPICSQDIPVTGGRLVEHDKVKRDGGTQSCTGSYKVVAPAQVQTDEPTKQRAGDQPLPSGGGDCVQDRIIAEMEESKRVGQERYGSVLRTFNGRRSIQDLCEEVRDLHVYATQIKMEAEAAREELIEVVARALVGKSSTPGSVDVLAQTAVDAVMGWVAGQLVASVVRAP